MAANIRAIFLHVGQSLASKLGQARDFVQSAPSSFMHAVRSVFVGSTTSAGQPQDTSPVAEAWTAISLETQTPGDAPGRVVVEHGTAPSSLELTAALHNVIKDLESGFFFRQPRLVSDAVECLRPLATKRELTRLDLMDLIDATYTLRNFPQKDRFTAAQHASIERLERATHLFVGPTSGLRTSLSSLSARLEAKQSVPDFAAYLRAHHPAMIDRDPISGADRLTETGMRDYEGVKRAFNSVTKRPHVIRPVEPNMDEHEKDVAKLIGGEYFRYQNAIRGTDDQLGTKKLLIEYSQIVESLARANPERVSRERYATVFPGGVTHPDQLVAGHEYTEPGIVFVGGERPNDKGYRMIISLAKGIPVDARALYGHSRGDRDKMQWLTLPGAKFRFDGLEGGRSERYTTYYFTQIER
ncbi:hypothetical protein [Pandoraea pulmonicola]|uniref:Uncharacterized protein n=1 Tax=Pandoraea pulmonicola TaxID=93221 RepID=A0AAJ5D1F8_PANPU|nr:hypothetical protein [Pandoraea pulmonicola]AJC20177.1 hypothetical protein RO07_06375 [Pandoraea pulmonicola]SUA91490.1 Uncharacterised protein [Pandoraea pulmonicola]